MVWGTSSGASELGAFDAALAEAKLHNCNLVRLSSVIPPNATVVQSGTLGRVFEIGDIVPVVLADGRVTAGEGSVAAGLGWALAEEGGIFMEAVADKAERCREQIRRSLADARSTREWSWREEDHVRVVEKDGEPGDAAFVAAVYGRLELS